MEKRDSRTSPEQFSGQSQAVGQLLLLCQGLGVPVWAKFALDLGFRVVLITGKELRAKLPTRYSLLFPIFPYFSHYSLLFPIIPCFSLMFPIIP